jgi:hypothetical protein
MQPLDVDSAVLRAHWRVPLLAGVRPVLTEDALVVSLLPVGVPLLLAIQQHVVDIDDSVDELVDFIGDLGRSERDRLESLRFLNLLDQAADDLLIWVTREFRCQQL